MHERLLKVNAYFDLVLKSSGSSYDLTMRDRYNVYHTILSNVVQEKVYLINLKWTKSGTLGSYNLCDYEITITRLDTNTSNTATLTSREVGPSSQNTRVYWGGNAQFHCDGFYSDLIMTSTDAATLTKVQGYLLNKFNDTGPPPNGINAEWLLEVDIDAK